MRNKGLNDEMETIKAKLNKIRVDFEVKIWFKNKIY